MTYALTVKVVAFQRSLRCSPPSSPPGWRRRRWLTGVWCPRGTVYPIRFTCRWSYHVLTSYPSTRAPQTPLIFPRWRVCRRCQPKSAIVPGALEDRSLPGISSINDAVTCPPSPSGRDQSQQPRLTDFHLQPQSADTCLQLRKPRSRLENRRRVDRRISVWRWIVGKFARMSGWISSPRKFLRYIFHVARFVNSIVELDSACIWRGPSGGGEHGFEVGSRGGIDNLGSSGNEIPLRVKRFSRGFINIRLAIWICLAVSNYGLHCFRSHAKICHWQGSESLPQSVACNVVPGVDGWGWFIIYRRDRKSVV